MDLLLKIKWRPEIGDPSFMGWFTVFAYAAAALLAWRVGMIRRDRVWQGVALLLAALCVNKQFDLQSLFTAIGREISHQGGWYERRREFQKVFVLGVVAGAGVFGLWFLWRFREFLAGHKLLAAGLLFLLTFIVVRAISFHHFDLFLKSRIAGVKMNWVLELGGIGLVAIAALRERRAPEGRRPSATC
jgi:hypothetical protein